LLMLKKDFLVFVIFVFLIFAVLQCNDPDPYLWFPLYAWVSCLGMYAWKRNIPVGIVRGTILIYLALCPYFASQITVWDMDTEEVRESLGLLLAAFTTWILGKLGSKT